MAKRVRESLRDRREDDAFQIVSKTKDVLKWNDEGFRNWTLIHWAAYEKCNFFLLAVFGDEKVVIF